MSVSPWIEKLFACIHSTSSALPTVTADSLAEHINQLPIVDQGRLRAAAEAVHVGPNRTILESTFDTIRILTYRNNQIQRRVTIRLGVPA